MWLVVKRVNEVTWQTLLFARTNNKVLLFEITHDDGPHNRLRTRLEIECICTNGDK